MPRIFRTFLVAVIVASGLSSHHGSAAETKNVILLIADGAGYNTFQAASMYQGKWDGTAGRSLQVFDGPEWKKVACSTFSLNMMKAPTGCGTQDPALVYDPNKAWDRQDGYTWIKETYTDSAAAATALATGQKTYNSAINWSDLKEPLKPTVTERAKEAGKAIGIVTSVQWSHATPAGSSHARAADRDQYETIANQMLAGDVLDVVMGGGNPDFDNDSEPRRAKKEYKYVGGEATWQAIELARSQPDGLYQGFRPVSTKAEFEALVDGPVPARVLGTAPVGTTLQQARKKGASTDDPALDTPLNTSVPSLATMVQGALNILDDRPAGFFLMVEGGAPDWAAHDNQMGRLLQEQIAFQEAVEAVVAWVQTHSSWDETLVVITADHETGMLWGPESDTVPFAPLVDRGPGCVPGFKFNSEKHTNSLVPVYARGPGSERLADMVQGTDPVRGPYVDNTDIAKLLHQAVSR
jgi:alkaline phosphatase